MGAGSLIITLLFLSPSHNNSQNSQGRAQQRDRIVSIAFMALHRTTDRVHERRDSFGVEQVSRKREQVEKSSSTLAKKKKMLSGAPKRRDKKYASHSERHLTCARTPHL